MMWKGVYVVCFEIMGWHWPVGSGEGNSIFGQEKSCYSEKKKTEFQKARWQC